MRTYSKLNSDFWLNYENAELISSGTDTQLLALYLIGNSHHNMLGVYCLPVAYIANDTKMSLDQVKTALQKLCKIGYCMYDEKTQYIWVCNMVFEQIGKSLDAKDNRVKSLQAIWKNLPSSLSFLEEIYKKYNAAFHLEPRLFIQPADKNNDAKPSLLPTILNPLQSPSEASSEGYNTQNHEALPPSEELPSSFEAPSDYLQSPFGYPSKPLQRGFRPPSKPVTEAVEERTKKLEVEKERDNIKTSVVQPNIVAQARPCSDENPRDVFYIYPKTPTLASAHSKNLDNQILFVFEHWKSVMQHSKSNLDSKRRALIRKALQGYSVEELCQAITGCSRTAHNIGQNDRGQRFDGLHIILRDADQIDRFINNYHNPPQTFSKEQQRLKESYLAAREWVQKKRHEN